MNEKEFEEFRELLSLGELEALDSKLSKLPDDNDSKYLRLFYSLDESMSGEEFDKIQVAGLEELASRWHSKSLWSLAWVRKFEDPSSGDRGRDFILFLAAAAILGDSNALKDFSEILENELSAPGFMDAAKQT